MKILVRLTIAIIIIGLGITFYVNTQKKGKEKPSVETPKSGNVVTTYRSTIKNNPYSLHVAVGKKLTGQPFKNKEEIEAAHRKGMLSRVKDSKGVIIDDLTHSKPYLHKEAANILREIGIEFRKKSPKNSFVVTSLTRPTERQRDLTKTNPNASPNISSHSYGVSFDIAYTKFNKDRKYNHDAHKAVEEVLKKFQADGKIYVIREKNSACYHITVSTK